MFISIFFYHCVVFHLHFVLKDGKVGNSDRQNNGPVVVKASKDKKKVNLKVIFIIFTFVYKNFYGLIDRRKFANKCFRFEWNFN